jgi:hypothetical protein
MKGERVARIHVALDKSMTDEEIVQALKDAAEAARNEDTSVEADEATETLSDEVSDE